MFLKDVCFSLLLPPMQRGASEDHVTAGTMIQRHRIIVSAVRSSYCMRCANVSRPCLRLGKHVFWGCAAQCSRDACGNPSILCRGSPVRLTRVAGQSTKQWAHISPLPSSKFIITFVHPHTHSPLHAAVLSFHHHFARHPVVSQRSLLCRHNR